MKWKCFILTALLAVWGTMIFAQPAFVFSPATIPDGLYGSPYTNLTLTVTGGMPPYSFSISSGSLPPGITLSMGGVLSGTPTAAGKYSFTVEAQGKGLLPGPHSGSMNYTLTVNPAPLTITANNESMTYGGAVPSLSASFAGWVNGDKPSSLKTQPSLTTTATSSSPVGAYPITAAGAKDSDYTISYVPGTLTIGAATVHVTANAEKKEYGASDPTLSFTFTGLPHADSAATFTGTLIRTPGEAIGTYPITVGTLSAGRNYTIGYTGNLFTIDKASQQINWSQSLVVGCNTQSQLQLTAAATSELAVTYSVSDTTVATVSGKVLTLLKPGTALVTASQAGNTDYDAAREVTDTLLFQPVSLIAQHWSDVIFFDNSSGDYAQWQWYKNGIPVAGDTTPYYSETPSLNGQYYVIATNLGGQRIQSCTLTITAGATIAGVIQISPNPAGAGWEVTFVCNYSVTELQGAILQITDISGRILQQIKNVQPSMQLTMPSTNGIYIVSLMLATGQRICTNVLVGE